MFITNFKENKEEIYKRAINKYKEIEPKTSLFISYGRMGVEDGYKSLNLTEAEDLSEFWEVFRNIEDEDKIKTLTNFSKDKEGIYARAIDIYKKINPKTSLFIDNYSEDEKDKEIKDDKSLKIRKEEGDISLFWSIYEKIKNPEKDIKFENQDITLINFEEYQEEIYKRAIDVYKKIKPKTSLYICYRAEDNLGRSLYKHKSLRLRKHEGDMSLFWSIYEGIKSSDDYIIKKILKEKKGLEQIENEAMQGMFNHFGF